MRRLKFLPIVSFILVLSSCQTSQKGAKSANSDGNRAPVSNAKWQKLFDGKTTNGWHTYGKDSVSKAWRVEDGTLRFDAAIDKASASKEGGDIVTDEIFNDFHLKLDWKISDKGNSGVLIYVQEDPAKYYASWLTGPEIQLLDNAIYGDRKVPVRRAGDLYDLISSSPETVLPAGQWNKLEVISQNSQLTIIQNGQKVLSTTMWDDNWKAMLAKSKFSELPGFGVSKSGRIALQEHNNDVWFRSIMIKRL